MDIERYPSYPRGCDIENITERLLHYDSDLEQIMLSKTGQIPLEQIIEKGQETPRWKLRAKVGERVRWYDLPEAPIRTS